MRKLLLRILLGLLLAFGAAIATIVGRRPETPPFVDVQGKVIPNSIASLEHVQLGGIDQTILIRGKNTSNPVLLFLHGGPGMPAMYLAYAFQRPLEEQFVVVQWDQRGAGKSYRSDIPVGTMNVEQFISDTVQLTQLLSQRFGQQTIYLVGHSWGSYLGMLVVKRHPELYRAFVGVGQVSGAGAQVAQIQDDFIRQQARASGNQQALTDLQNHPDESREKWLFYYGGELVGATNFMPLLFTGLRSPEYSLWDDFQIQPGVAFSGRNMQYNAIHGALMDTVTQVDVPVYFMMGRNDYTTPFKLAEEYYSRLQAPAKSFVWFEHSAHFPFFEEPQHFAEAMQTVLAQTLSGTMGP